MKRCLTVFLAGLLVAAFVAPAMAWEFNLTGEYEFRLRYIGRTGDADLFGIAPLQDSFLNSLGAFVGFAGPSWYNRGAFPAGFADQALAVPVKITRGGYSRWGSDALYNDSRLTLEPVLQVNPAIRVFGVYTIGGYRHKFFQSYNNLALGDGIGTPPFERYYMSQTSMNAYDTAAIGSWEQFRATVQMPIGLMSIGVKDFPFGVGATFGNNTREESFVTVLPYGPWRWIHGIWFAQSFVASWSSVPDGATKPNLFQGLLFTYDVATLNLGGCAVWRMTHFNRAESATAWGAASTNGADFNELIWHAFLKYNDGRFFAAAEYASVQGDIYRLGNRAFILPPEHPTLAIGHPLYIEAWHWWSELGSVAGPAKLRLLYSVASGHVFNNPNPTKLYRPWAIDYQAMKPYQFLMFETYAGGNDGGWNGTDVTFVSEDHGMMTDAYCYAARVDYAVASNLNFWVSYIWAHRLERAGWYAGGKLSTGANASLGLISNSLGNTLGFPFNTQVLTAQAFKTANGFGPNPNPYVDDGYLGWELGIGLDWKLLENLNMHVQWNYWQPGDWFDQAYRVIGLQRGAFSDNALLVGRSPIQAIQGSFLISF